VQTVVIDSVLVYLLKVKNTWSVLYRFFVSHC